MYASCWELTRINTRSDSPLDRNFSTIARSFSLSAPSDFLGENAGSLRFYIDKAEDLGLDAEMFVDADYKQFPLRRYRNLAGDRPF